MKSRFILLKIITKITKKEKGFTILELLIVIGIIAILSVALVFVLNPAEALKKSRDSLRMSDLNTLKKAIEIYKTNISSPKLAGTDNEGCKGTPFSTNWQPATDHIYYSLPSEVGTISKSLDGITFTTGGPVQVAKANLGNINGTGWLPIDFSTLSGGSPISNLPIDPTNSAATPSAPTSSDLVYRYICSEKDLTYEINATLESQAYTTTENKAAKDGGNSDSYYEVGTGLALMSVESPAPLVVGDSYGGGKVAYILQSGDPGYVVGATHGLIAAASDQSAGIYWHALNSVTTGATGTALGTGNANTNTIVASYGVENNAARLCYDLVLDSYSDWYLPSVDELNKLFLNRLIIGGFNTVDPSIGWWSSKENSQFGANFQYFPNSAQGNNNKNTLYHVRCTRSF